MTEFKSNEKINSFLSGKSSSDDDHSDGFMPKPGISELVPPFVKDMCRRPKSVEMRVCYDAPTLQSTYTYTINWDDDDYAEEKYRQIVEKMGMQLSRSNSFSSIQLNKFSSSTTATIDDHSNTSIRGPPPVSAICDGPCKKSFPSNLLNTIGRCGHYLCTACFGIVKNSDGTNGCSSQHCNWKGDNRKESKRHYEKEICRKQRLRAREMKSRGIDVKSASTASSSSRTNSTKSSPTTPTSECSDETDCSVISFTSSSKASNFKLIFPSTQEIIGVKLLIFESTESQGMKQSNAELEAPSTTKVNKMVTNLLHQKYGTLPRHHSGVLYYVELQADWTKIVRRIRKEQYNTLSLFHFPQIAEYVMFVLDFGGFVNDGTTINIECEEGFV